MNIPHQYDPRTPRTEHAGFAAAMYMRTLREADGPILNVAAGGTDLQDDLQHLGVYKAVTSLDPSYAHLHPDDRRYGRPDYVPGVAQKIPCEDGTFAMTLCQFGMQHIPPEQWGSAIREMVRVTRTATGRDDTTKGIILINPVFNASAMQKTLEARDVKGFAGLAWHDPKDFVIQDRRAVKDSLWIHKTPDLSPEKLDVVIAAAVSVGALKPRHRELAEIVSRALGGRSNI